MSKKTSLWPLALMGSFLLLTLLSGCEPLGEGPSTTGAVGAIPPGYNESSVLPVGDSPLWGDYQAQVTIALFSDFNLPEALQTAQMVKNLISESDWNDKVRMVIKAVPGRGEVGEPLVSAILYADQNGLFWSQMFDPLVASGGNLTVDGVRELVVQAGLDGEEFDRIVEEGTFSPAIEANRMLARTLRTGRTSAVVVNGTLLRDVTAEQVRSLVQSELEASEQLQAAGVPPGQVYARRVLENAPTRERRDPRALREDALRPERPLPRTEAGAQEAGREGQQDVERPPALTAEQVAQRIAAATPPADDVERWNVAVGDSPLRGAVDAPVTLMVFNDFHCPYSRRGSETIRQLLDAYGDQVRVVFKNNPLPMHPEAPLAHQAALAAGAQGKFWEMHDLIFANTQARSREDLEGFAQQLGLNMDQFRAYLDGNQGSAAIEADQALASRAAARGTPHFFINGRRLRGAQPIERFADIIDSEIALANRLVEQGTARGQVYDAIMARAQALPEVAPEQAEAPPAPAPARSREERLAAATPPPENTERMRVALGDSPVTGPEDAPVTIVVFTDFHCPYSRRGNDTINQVVEEYGADVRMVFKNNPLPMHPEAPLAHQAAMAAGVQGKFWEMAGLIFANAQARSRADLEGFAQQLGLDMAAFGAALDQNAASEQISADQQLANQIGARGTPHFFINGRRLRGAQPIERFYEVIDSELALANQLTQRGIARNQIYDHLMASALEAPAPEPAAPPAIAEMPPIGEAPVLGPDTAPITIFMWDEFQCPYCRRAEDTLRQVREHYGDQVRFVWKDFPLPFHDNALIAAQAAYAAGEQGKFWEYHDILFQNQRNMTRPDLERYAEQLGLDMAQFREALDSDRFNARIESNKQEGQRLGVSGTPTFFINGERLVGAVPFAQFQAIIDRTLQN
ncbi:MAG: thioredoxin domain-containing protein [Bradymonadales bacterium]|nr:thioredoxin domain-containing protein [Bradymonadales bacterium]